MHRLWFSLWLRSCSTVLPPTSSFPLRRSTHPLPSGTRPQTWKSNQVWVKMFTWYGILKGGVHMPFVYFSVVALFRLSLSLHLHARRNTPKVTLPSCAAGSSRICSSLNHQFQGRDGLVMQYVHASEHAGCLSRLCGVWQPEKR